MAALLDLWTGLTGTVLPFAGSVAPSGWLLCNGQAISRTTHKPLFDVIGTIYGAGNGSTTFNVPDLRGEFIRGLDNGRGIDSGRILGSDQEATGVHNRVGAATDGKFLVSTISGENATQNSDFQTYQAQSPSGYGASFVRMRPRNVALNYIIKT